MAFGLRNQRGSCWINAMLQGIFRIPELQKRFGDDEADSDNPVEMCLQEIWASRGDEGLRALYECIKLMPEMPAGEGIGDSHELFQYLCDKVPSIDKLVRFSIVHRIQCKHCDFHEDRKDSMTEFAIVPKENRDSVARAIADAVQPFEVADWTCDSCKKKGCTKQFLVESFPKVMVFHKTSVDRELVYPVVLTVNQKRYALMSVVCYTGAHWKTYGRNMPPGNSWHEFDDLHVRNYDAKYWPVVNTMRLLMYYRIDE